MLPCQVFSDNCAQLTGACRLWRATGRGVLSVGALVVLAGTGAEAQSLKNAMIAAYRHNPGLQSQRYKARASDEAVPRALSGYRPRLVGDAYYGGTTDRHAIGGPGSLQQTYGYGLKIEQPLFDGFQTRNGVLEAEAGVRASRHELKARENEILLQTAGAYLDVLRDEGIVLYRRKSLTSLKRELVAARERLGRGQVTQTDLEQARQRLSIAQSDLAKATGALEVSGLRFARIVGEAPRSLHLPGLPRRLMPANRRAAAEQALGESPIIAAAREKLEAAGHAVERVRGELLPSATLAGGYDRASNPSGTLRDEDGFSIMGRLRVPLYQGGEVSARVRQARQSASVLDREAEDVRLVVGEAVGAAWAELTTAKEREKLEEAAIDAAEKALAGVREEQRHGQRTLVAVLDAERELVEARIRILNTRRDLHVSAYALLRAIGNLTVASIAPDAEQYDPRAYYRQVRNKWWGTSTPDAGGDGFLGNRAPQGGRLPPPAALNGPKVPAVEANGWTTEVSDHRATRAAVRTH